MFKYQVNFYTVEGWKQTRGVYAALGTAEFVAEWVVEHAEVQTVLVSQIYIPHTERT